MPGAWVLAVDPFAVIILGGLAGLLVALLLLGQFYPGSGADQVDWRPTRSAAQDVQNDIDDLDGLLGAANARRRRRGRPELTEMGLHAELVAEQHRAVRPEAEEAEEITQMLDAVNARRRGRGQPETSLEEYRRSLSREDGA